MSNDFKILHHRVIAQGIDFQDAESRQESPKSVVDPEPSVDPADSSSSVNIDFSPHVVIAENSGGNARHQIVVVDPSVVFDLEEGSVGAVADPRCSIREDRLGA